MKKFFVNPNMEVVSFETEEAVTLSLFSIFDDAEDADPDTMDLSGVISSNFFEI